MADFASIKAQIKTKLQTITDLGNNGVLDYEPDNIVDVAQDPYATVVSSENENDYLTTGENQRVFGFVIRVYVQRGGGGRSASDAESVLTGIVDDIINAFDDDFTLSSTVLMVEATPSVWEYVISDKRYRTAEIRIRAKDVYTLT